MQRVNLIKLLSPLLLFKNLPIENKGEVRQKIII